MAKKLVRGQGMLKGAVGYPGLKKITTVNYPEAVLEDLKINETRLGLAKSTLSTYAIRLAKLARHSRADVERDIAKAAKEIKTQTTQARAKRWKHVF